MAGPTTLLLLALASAVAVAVAAPRNEAETSACPRCNPDACPKGSDDCPYGLVGPDPCDCCRVGVCGRPEGTKCYNKTLSLPPAAIRYGICGEDSVCLPRDDLRPWDEPEATCECKDRRPACGTDNRTYDSACVLRREAVRMASAPNAYDFPTLTVRHMGPCATAPWVISPPSNQNPREHTSMALDCEVKGYPAPSVYWEFQSLDGSFKVLPSDDLYVAVQVRGGPEAFMATSWVQIVDVRRSDAGVYTCVGKNSEGVVRSSATVTLR